MPTEPRRRKANATPTPQQREKVIQFFGALAHEGRLLVLLSLSQDGALSVGELQERTGLEQSALSHQLRLLKEANLVFATRSGQQVIYELDDDHVIHVVQDAFAHVLEDRATQRRVASHRHD